MQNQNVLKSSSLLHHPSRHGSMDLLGALLLAKYSLYFFKLLFTNLEIDDDVQVVYQNILHQHFVNIK